MAYVPNADEVGQPTIGQKVSSAAEEFRTVKSRIQHILRVAADDLALSNLPLAASRLDRMAGFNPLNGDVTVTPFTMTEVAAVIDQFYSLGGTSADLIMILQSGVGALSRSVQAKAREFPSLQDYGTIPQAITAAIANGTKIGVNVNTTVRIPTDATLQQAVDYLTPTSKQVTITLQIAAGHALTAGITISGVDCSQFQVTSIDAEVAVAPGFAVDVFEGRLGAFMPRLSCLINCANQVAGNGYDLLNASCVVDALCGIKNAWGTGLALHSGGFGMASGAIFTGAARNNITGSGMSAWGSRIFAEGADVSNSIFYGAQAAHGGVLSFRNGKANNCFRHGIRATDSAIVDADAAQANGCGGDGSGRCVYAYEAGVVNFVNGQADGCLGYAALFAYGAGSAINAEGATAINAAQFGALVQRGGKINAVGATITGAVTANFARIGDDGRIARADDAISGFPTLNQAATIAAGKILFTPNPDGLTRISIANEGAAATDNLDELQPLAPFVMDNGHIVVLRASSNAQVPTIRDISVSGAPALYGFQTAGPNASQVLGNSAKTAMFMWTGANWVQLSFSDN